ncbi:MAG: phosphoglucosamine mutase [Candidatus Sumerlaeales bacterium]|nr:phosphoglucosamine mutase [Candidatus Sumerlaeales bacterium]
MSKPMISVAGIRGIVGDSLQPESFLRFILAFGTMANGGKIVIGTDSRLTRDMMRHLAFAGLASTGCSIIDIGLAPTPTIAMAVRDLRAAGGIAITASHNPPQWNAYKFFDGNGAFLNREENAKLVALAESGGFYRANYRGVGKLLKASGLIETHIQKVLQNIDAESIRIRHFKVVADCCNGVGGLIIEPLLKQLNATAIMIGTNVNEEFSRVAEPLPEYLGKLSQTVLDEKADIGFALDPDADRLAIVDDKGRPIGEERTVTLCSDSVLANGDRGALVVNLSTTRAMDDVAAKYGVDLIRTPIGEANVMLEMRRHIGLIGGEGNGGVIYPRIHPGRDAATGVGLILAALAKRNITISELNATIPDYAMFKTKFPIGEINIEALYEKMTTAFSDAQEIVTTDGMKIVYPNKWVHMRPSGTEPVVRIFAEAPKLAEAEQLARKVATDVIGK